MYIYYKGKEHAYAVGVSVYSIYCGGYIVKVDENSLDWFDYSLADASVVLTEEEVVFGLNHMGKTQLKYFTDDDGVIYDTYDADSNHTKVKRDFTADEVALILSFVKKTGIVIAEAKYSAMFNVINKTSMERVTWTQQLAEARAGSGTLITALATARGITVESLITKIINKNTAYEASIADILGRFQQAKDWINSKTTVADSILIMERVGMSGTTAGTSNL